MQSFKIRYNDKEIDIKLSPVTFAVANKFIMIKREQQAKYSDLDKRYSYIADLAVNSPEWLLESSKKYDEYVQLEWYYQKKYFACLPLRNEWKKAGLSEELLDDINAEFWDEQDMTAVEEAVKFFREKARV